jgi:hypothetical protein
MSATAAVSAARSDGNVRSVTGRQGFRWIALAVAVIVTLLAVWGWSQWMGGSGVSSQPIAVSGTVGVVGGPASPSTSGPAIPVNHPEPLPFRRVVVTGTTTAGAAFHRDFRTDGHGRFALGLPTGTYRVTAIVMGNVPLAFQPSEKVVVRSGHPIHLRIIYPAS